MEDDVKLRRLGLSLIAVFVLGGGAWAGAAAGAGAGVLVLIHERDLVRKDDIGNWFFWDSVLPVRCAG